jgi:hypothetical protein
MRFLSQTQRRCQPIALAQRSQDRLGISRKQLMQQLNKRGAYNDAVVVNSAQRHGGGGEAKARR